MELEDIKEEWVDSDSNEVREDISVVGEEDVPLQTRKIRKSTTIEAVDF